MVWLEINQNWIVPTDPFEGASCLFASALHPYVCEMVEGMCKDAGTHTLTHKQFTHHPPSSISTQLVCLSSKGIEESDDGSGDGHDGQEIEDGHGGIMTIDCVWVSEQVCELP